MDCGSRRGGCSQQMKVLSDREARSLPASDIADSEFGGRVEGRQRRRKRKTRSVVSQLFGQAGIEIEHSFNTRF